MGAAVAVGRVHPAFNDPPTGQEASQARPPEEALIANGLSDESLRFEVARVENWTLSRCSLRRTKPLYHLVRVFSEGREVGRAALLASGLWARFRTFPEGSGKPLAKLDEVAARLAQRLGAARFVEQPQLVALDGLHGCGPLDPCVAVATASQIAVETADGGLFEIARDDAWLSVTDWRRQAGARLQPLEPSDAPLVSLGFAWGRAHRIADLPH